MHQERSSFANLLKRRRLVAGLSQEELAGRAGLSPRAISDLERGEHTNPRPATVRLLADALGLRELERALFLAAAQGARVRPEPDSPDVAPMQRDELHAVANQASPAAIHAFLIADVRGYTRFTIEHGDEVTARLAAKFAHVAREVVEAHGGRVVELRGDEVLAVLVSTRQALRAALALQARAADETEVDPTLPLRIGIGLDAGEALPVEDGYRGAALNLAARLCSIAKAGEVLASEGILHLARKVEGIEYEDRGTAELKGFAEPARVFRVVDARDQVDTTGERETAKDADTADTGAPAELPLPALPVGGFLGAAPDESLVARETEIQRLEAALDAVGVGSARLVLLAGEPGVGKTRLAQEVMLAARRRGFVVATGRCYEPQQAVAYYPFLEALHHAYGQAPTGVRRQLATRWPGVARLLPEQSAMRERSSTASIGIATAAEHGDDQQRLFWHVTGFLQALAAELPVALLLDDLHWADSASLALVQHLARHTRADRVLVLGTYRDVEVNRQHPLEAALRDLMREQVLERLAVRRLPEEGTTALIRATLHTADIPPEFTDLLHQRAEGNPFFTRELLRALIEQGDVYRDAGGDWSRRGIGEIAVPESVRSVIGQRLSRLAEATQTVLVEASVLGQTFSFADLQGMSGQDEQAVEGALDEAMAAGLVHEVREAWEMRARGSHARQASREQDCNFSHALVQQALYAELSSRRKRRLHRAAAEAIEARPERQRQLRCAELAWHFVEADEPLRALPYVLQAGDQAEAVYAHAEAGQQFRVAAELAHEVGDRAREAEALEKLGTTCHLSSHYQDAVDAFERAQALYDEIGDAEGATRALAHFVELCAVQGEAQRALTRATPALAMLQHQPASPAIARLYWSLTMLYIGEVELNAALDASEKAVAAASAVADPFSFVRAKYWYGSTLLAMDRLAEGTRIMEELIPLAEAVGDLLTLSFALVFVAHAHERSGDLQASRPCRDRALEVAERLGEPVEIASRLGGRGWLWLRLGEWARARADFERAVALLREAETTTFGFAHGFLLLATLQLLEGRRDEANALFAEGLEVSAGWDKRGDRRFVGQVLAERDLLERRPHEALARIEPLLDVPGRQEVDVTPLLAVMAWALCDVGDVSRAADVVAQAIRRSTDEPSMPVLVDALWTQGLIYVRQHRWHDAEAALEQAIQMARGQPYPYAEAKALYVYGWMRTEQGDVVQARERFEAALAICAQLGERLYAERIEQELAKLGAAPAGMEVREAP
jgi:class 3 adenylate cyclase/tetratricopeptide (TPR) repeat protein